MVFFLGSQAPLLPGEKTEQELALEGSNDFRALQRYRMNLWERTNNISSANVPLFAFLRAEESLRMICQKEIALRGRPDPSQTRESRELQRNAWLLEREWRYWRSVSMDSPSVIERGFKQWRSDPRWYMHSVLVEDCVNRGGCCSRDCGCCVSHERETSSVGGLGVGYCTVECGCCSKARGFDLTAREKNVLETRFGFFDIIDDDGGEDDDDDDEYDDEDDDYEFDDEDDGYEDVDYEDDDYFSYQYRLCCASVWGLLRNDSVFGHQRFFCSGIPAPIFQSQLVKFESSSTVDDSKTLLEDDFEETDSTIMEIMEI